MELTEEFIQENGLNEAQVSAVKTYATDHVSKLETEWSGKANENAEKILTGVASQVEALTGIKREQGERYKDYLEKSSNLFFEGTKSSLERKEKELDQKIKEGATDIAVVEELEKTKESLSKLKQKEAQFNEWEEKDYKGKYEQAEKDLTLMQRNVAFSSVKPTFATTTNKYEAATKWGEFQKLTEEKYNIVLDEDNTPWAVDKNNEFVKHKLSDLAEKDETLKALSEGRRQTGTGADTKTNIKIEGVPFEVPEDATSAERQKAVKDYLASQSISKTSDEYAKQFSELNKKILEKNPVKK